MTEATGEVQPGRKYIVALVIAIAPFILIPLLGSQFYFRHDDASVLLWAKEFDHPLHHIFSADPAMNHFNDYPGMAGAWRPFNFLYIKLMWHLFDAHSNYHQIIGGLCFIGVVALLFGLVAKEYGLLRATLSCLALFIAFHNTMYTLFHTAVPVSFLYQTAMIFCFWRYVRGGRWQYAIGLVLLLGPSMGRQTTAIILAAILIISFFNRPSKYGPLRGRAVLAASIIGVQVYLGTLNPNIGYGTVFSMLPDYGRVLAFVHERYIYYGMLLTSDITGIIVLTLFTMGTVANVACRFQRTKRGEWMSGLSLPVSFIAALILLGAQPYATYWLTLCILYLFFTDSDLRLPLGWGGTSLIVFFSISYYHNGYLLESAIPLSIALAVLTVRSARSIGTLRRRVHLSPKRATGVGACIATAVVISTLLFGDGIHFARQRIELLRISIDSNRNFAQLMHYMSSELPRGAVVYELDEEQFGTTSRDRRFLPLRRRAEIIKIMNIRDQLVMMKVLQREDIHIRPITRLGEAQEHGERYVIVLNSFEREIAESLYDLHLLREFRKPFDAAAIYTLSPGLH